MGFHGERLKKEREKKNTIKERGRESSSSSSHRGQQPGQNYYDTLHGSSLNSFVYVQ